MLDFAGEMIISICFSPILEILTDSPDFRDGPSSDGRCRYWSKRLMQIDIQILPFQPLVFQVFEGIDVCRDLSIVHLRELWATFDAPTKGRLFQVRRILLDSWLKLHSTHTFQKSANSLNIPFHVLIV